MKAESVVKYVVIPIGVSLLIFSFYTFRGQSAFVSEAIKTEGAVVDFVKKEFTEKDSRSRITKSTYYHPIVQFVTQDGQVVEFTSSVGSNEPTYSKGQKIEVLYLPTEPQSAQINSFYSLWMGSIILGSFGGILFLIGTGILYVNAQQDRRDEYLKRNGAPIETEFQRVELNTNVSVKGAHPYKVVTQWMNPATSELHLFKSNNLWLDPTPYIKSKKITVLIEIGNPKKYYVDLSFIPELEKNAA